MLHARFLLLDVLHSAALHLFKCSIVTEIASECGYGWLNNVEGLPKELLIPFLEHSSRALVETGEEHGLADAEQVRRKLLLFFANFASTALSVNHKINKEQTEGI